MNAKQTCPQQWALYFLAAGFALTWRIGALLSPSSFISISPGMQIPMALLGLFFLGCGSYTYYRRQDAAARVFFIYAVGAAIHWGGSIGAPGILGVVLLFAYLAISALGEGALVHLALIYPHKNAQSDKYLLLAYGPAALGALSLVGAVWLPRETLETIAGLVIGLTVLLSLIAAIVLITRYHRFAAKARKASRLRPVIYLGLGSGLLGALGSTGLFFGATDMWNLLFGVLPITLAFALTGPPPA